MKLNFKLLTFTLIAPITLIAMEPEKFTGFGEEESSQESAAGIPKIELKGSSEIEERAALEGQQSSQNLESNPFEETVIGDEVRSEAPTQSTVSRLAEATEPIIEKGKASVVAIVEKAPVLFRQVADNINSAVETLRSIDWKGLTAAARERFGRILDLLVDLRAKLANLRSNPSAAEKEQIVNSIDNTEKEIEESSNVLPSEVIAQLKARALPVLRDARSSLVVII